MTAERRPSGGSLEDPWKHLSPYLGLNDGLIDWPLYKQQAYLETTAEDAEVAAFDQLRSDTYGQMQQEISERLAYNPTPSPF